MCVLNLMVGTYYNLTGGGDRSNRVLFVFVGRPEVIVKPQHEEWGQAPE